MGTTTATEAPPEAILRQHLGRDTSFIKASWELGQHYVVESPKLGSAQLQPSPILHSTFFLYLKLFNCVTDFPFRLTLVPCTNLTCRFRLLLLACFLHLFRSVRIHFRLFLAFVINICRLQDDFIIIHSFGVIFFFTCSRNITFFATDPGNFSLLSVT